MEGHCSSGGFACQSTPAQWCALVQRPLRAVVFAASFYACTTSAVRLKQLVSIYARRTQQMNSSTSGALFALHGLRPRKQTCALAGSAMQAPNAMLDRRKVVCGRRFKPSNLDAPMKKSPQTQNCFSPPELSHVRQTCVKKHPVKPERSVYTS